MMHGTMNVKIMFDNLEYVDAAFLLEMTQLINVLKFGTH
jgi:hypothetical protein